MFGASSVFVVVEASATFKEKVSASKGSGDVSFWIDDACRRKVDSISSSCCCCCCVRPPLLLCPVGSFPKKGVQHANILFAKSSKKAMLTNSHRPTASAFWRRRFFPRSKQHAMISGFRVMLGKLWGSLVTERLGYPSEKLQQGSQESVKIRVRHTLSSLIIWFLLSPSGIHRGCSPSAGQCGLSSICIFLQRLRVPNTKPSCFKASRLVCLQILHIPCMFVGARCRDEAMFPGCCPRQCEDKQTCKFRLWQVVQQLVFDP